MKQAIFTCILFILYAPCAGAWQNELKKKIAEGKPPRWMMEQIREDLQLYKKNGMRKHLIKAHYPLCKHIKIMNNQVMKVENDPLQAPVIEDRYKDIISHLRDLCSCVRLPNVEFIINLSDGYISGEFAPPNVPIFAFSKNKKLHSSIILMPDNMTLQTAKQHEKKNTRWHSPWHKKENKAFWRGATTSGFYFTMDTFQHAPRYRLVILSKQFPHLLDAYFSHTPGCDKKVQIFFVEKKLLRRFESIEGHLKYKYQILIDGNTTSWERAYWQLYSNSVMFKHESDNIQWYYRALEPYKHYVPFKRDFSDLIPKILWARSHDKMCHKIVRKATRFAKKNLSYADMLYYIYLLLTEYAQLPKLSPS